MKDRIKGLDGLRAIAVLMVFLNHKSAEAIEFGIGGYGVRIFFILSGFLILGILYRQRQEIERSGGSPTRAWGDFLLNRSFRIFPIYYLLLVVIVVLGSVSLLPMLSAANIAWMATYTTNFPIAHITGDYPPTAGHLWSLAVEEQFYLISAPLILFVPKERAAWVCWLFVAVGFMATIDGTLAHNKRGVYVGSLSNFGFMGLGGLMGLSAHRFKRFFALPPSLYLATFLLCPFLSYYLRAHESVAQSATFFLSCISGGFLIGAVVQQQDSPTTRVLNSAPLRALGRVSYAFYLFHPFIELEQWFPSLDRPLAVALDFAATWGLAALSWMLIERPILDLRQRLLPREPVPQPQLVSEASGTDIEVSAQPNIQA